MGDDTDPIDPSRCDNATWRKLTANLFVRADAAESEREVEAEAIREQQREQERATSAQALEYAATEIIAQRAEIDALNGKVDVQAAEIAMLKTEMSSLRSARTGDTDLRASLDRVVRLLESERAERRGKSDDTRAVIVN